MKFKYRCERCWRDARICFFPGLRVCFNCIRPSDHRHILDEAKARLRELYEK